MTTPDVATATAPTPPPRIAARVRRPGVCYAVSDDGVELAVIDVTHPAFAVAIDDAELRSRVAAFRRTQGGLARLPARLRRPLLRWFLRDSELGRRIMRSDGTFMSGMDTYLLKLGPDNLDRRFHHPIDRVIADALPALSVRLRLQDVATLIAEAAAPALAAAPGRPWTIVDIAGGPALDAANALLVLRRDHPGVLDGHVVDVAVLDRDRAGPGFGARAVAALTAAGAPLHGVAVGLRRVPYDWTRPATLAPVLAAARAAGALIVATSEGGLFEYGGDDEIVGNLEALRAGGATAVVGSVTRDDELSRVMRRTTTAAVRPRGLDVFRPLAARAGWAVARAVARPFSDQVLLVPAPGAPA